MGRAAANSKRDYAGKVGLIADSPNFPAAWDQVLEKAKIADRLGYDSLWLGESWGYELFTSLTDLVRVTKRIKIGAGIANIYSRSPAVIASTIATLDERSGGRMMLGLGPSGAQVIEHWHGVPFEKPLRRTREYVEIIRLILRGEKLVYHGELFQLEHGFKLRFKPKRPDMPIYIAALGPQNVVQTGEIADGALPIYWPATKWGELRRELDEGAALAGRPPHSATIAPYLTCALLEEGLDEERRAARRLAATFPLAYYIGRMGSSYAQMLARHGFAADVQAVQAGWKQGMKAAVKAVSSALFEATTLVGTPAEVVTTLDRWVADGVEEPLLSMPTGSIEETQAQLGALMQALHA